jgi:hypothetical protein
MSKLNIKLNLSNLKGVVRYEAGETGPVECLIIPIEANHLFKGKSGIYLDLTAFELKEIKDNQTHLIKQSLPKEVYQKQTEEEKKTMPILGNVSTFEAVSSEPVISSEPLAAGTKLPF